MSRIVPRVLAAVESRETDVVLIDLNYASDTTSGGEGMDLLSGLQAIDATLRTQAELARALRRGQRLEAENRALRDEGRPLLIAESEAMRPVLEMIERVKQGGCRATLRLPR
jgi:hypothetical protein